VVIPLELPGRFEHRGRQLVDDGGAAKLVAMPRGARDRDDGHPGGERRLDAGRGVLDRDAVLGGDAETLGGGEEEVRRRLAALDLVAGDGDLEDVAEAGGAKRRVEPFARARRRDRDAHAAAMQLARSRDRVVERRQIALEQLEQRAAEAPPELVCSR